jgi:hypothetical protein
MRSDEAGPAQRAVGFVAAFTMFVHQNALAGSGGETPLEMAAGSGDVSLKAREKAEWRKPQSRGKGRR